LIMYLKKLDKKPKKLFIIRNEIFKNLSDFLTIRILTIDQVI